MPHTLTIGGKNLTRLISPQSRIRARRVLGPGGSGTMALALEVKVDDRVGGRDIPTLGQEVIWQFTDPNNSNTVSTIFSGILDTIDMFYLNPNTLQVDCSVRDYTKWLDRELVAGFFTDANAGDMIKTIVAAHAPDINTDNVDTGIPIFPKSFDWAAPSAAIQEIAEDTGYVWWLDPVKSAGGDPQLYFKPRYSQNAPRLLLRPDTDFDFGDLQITKDISKVVNRIVIKDFHYRSPDIYYENLEDDDTGDSITFSATTKEILNQQYKLMYTPYDVNDITVTRTDVAPEISYTVVTEEQASAAGYGTGATPGAGVVPTNSVVLHFGDSGGAMIRWPTGNEPPTNSTWRISYRPMKQSRIPELIADIFSIMYFREREGGGSQDGVYDDVLSLQDVEITGSTNTDIVQNVLTLANRRLRRHAWPQTRGSFTVYSDQLTGALWAPGQWFDIFSEKWRLFDPEQFWKTELFNPGQGPKVALRVWVTSVQYSLINDNIIRYNIEFSSTPRFE